jgi:hypothetical protein
MRWNRGLVAVLAGSAVLLVGGGTAALAANGGGHAQHQARCDMRLAKVAQKKGVPADQLEAQIKARLLARVDALLKAGKISSARAAALEKRISAATVICPGARARHPLARRGLQGMLKAAADFLGLDGQALRAQLPGTSLVALAGHQGKSQADLEAAMLAPAKARLAKAVDTQHLSQARADQALARLTKLADRLATKTFPAK